MLKRRVQVRQDKLRGVFALFCEGGIEEPFDYWRGTPGAGTEVDKCKITRIWKILDDDLADGGGRRMKCEAWDVEIPQA